MIIGLTGGIASGKSTVTDMLRGFGAYVVDADVWARKVVEPKSDGLREIVEVFGSDILEPDGSLSRPKLGQIIFTNREARAKLNAITHPRVRAGMNQETQFYLETHPDEPVIWDVPLLFEGETHKLVDQTIVVYVNPNLQLERLMARNGYSREEAEARISSQMPIDEKKKLATYVIDNSGTLTETREQVRKVWQTIRGQNSKDRGFLS